MDGSDQGGLANCSNIFNNHSNNSMAPATSSPYDHEGALKFTVAVVFVYGVGVILMLGFHAKIKRSSLQTEEDGYEYVKRWSQCGSRMEKKEKKVMYQTLIQGTNMTAYTSNNNFKANGNTTAVPEVTVSPIVDDSTQIDMSLLQVSLKEDTDLTRAGSEM